MAGSKHNSWPIAHYFALESSTPARLSMKLDFGGAKKGKKNGPNCVTFFKSRGLLSEQNLAILGLILLKSARSGRIRYRISCLNRTLDFGALSLT